MKKAPDSILERLRVSLAFDVDAVHAVLDELFDPTVSEPCRHPKYRSNQGQIGVHPNMLLKLDERG